MQLPIGVIDSGLGGASILKACKELLKEENFVYLADTQNAPYGNKRKKEIIKLTLDLVDFLVQKRAIKLLVVACNTASATAKQAILTKYPSLPCVFVEPPIKMAFDKNKKNILILATKQTLKQNLTIKYYQKLSKNKKVKITKCFIEDLASAIDKNYNSSKIKKLLKENLPDKNFDCVVLGCTHYNFIKYEIKQVLPHASIIACEKNIAMQVKNILFKREVKQGQKNNAQQIEILLTEHKKEIKERLTKLFPTSISN